mmetsp:Transcript_216/g.343  ORF Transcript_216/g.343 Transcript_216/m.343 type:complete len:286 (-) Transcript_216:512-1369(-)
MDEHEGKLIYHEKQSCAMCGQHVLNSLLQGPYFTAEDLAEIAHELDERERELLRSQEGLTDGEQTSHNVDDSGNFSLQVLNSALQRSHNLNLVRDSQTLNFVFQNLESTALDETNAPAFVCNRHNHWQAIRFLHGSYWDLNSLSNIPTKISIFYLTAYLGQLIQDGWTIFTVDGVLPNPMNDVTIGNRSDWYVIGQQIDNNNPDRIQVASSEEDSELQAALRASLETATINTTEDAELQAALKASLDAAKQKEERNENENSNEDGVGEEEDADLKAAIALSLQDQ